MSRLGEVRDEVGGEADKEFRSNSEEPLLGSKTASKQGILHFKEICTLAGLCGEWPVGSQVWL